MGELLDYSKDLGRLAELAAQPQSIDDVLSSALASLRRIIHYDLAAIYELSDDQRTLQLRAAHGPLADERIAGHRLELARFATIRRALEQRHCLFRDRQLPFGSGAGMTAEQHVDNGAGRQISAASLVDFNGDSALTGLK